MTPTTTRKADGGSVGDVLDARRRAGPRAGDVGTERGRVPRSRPSSRTASSPRANSASCGSTGAPATRSRRASRWARARATTSSRFFAVQLHLLGSTHQSQGDTPIAGQLLQMYQGTVEGKLTLRLVQWSFFAEGGLGAARMSSNLLYARGLATVPHRLHLRRRRRRRLPLPVAPLLDRRARRLLRAAATSPAAGTLIDHHVPEVHVLMRARALLAIALRRGVVARRAARPSISGKPPSDINACRPSQQYFVDRDLAELPGQGRLPGRRALLRCRLPRRAGAERAGPDRADDPAGRLPIPLTGDWAANYMTVTEEMSCSNVASSKLLELPGRPEGPRRRQADRAGRPRGDPHQDVDLCSRDPPSGRGCRRRSPPRWPSPARAEDQALVRVIAEAASVRTGPGFGYRSVYRANQGEVLTVIGRATHDHWFRVELPDGTYGWILGDEVFPLDVDMAAAHRGPSIWRRMGHAIFSPSPLMIENVTFTFSAGRAGRRRHVPVPARGAAGAPRVAGGDHRRDGGQPGRRHLRGRRLQRLPVPDVAR